MRIMTIKEFLNGNPKSGTVFFLCEPSARLPSIVVFDRIADRISPGEVSIRINDVTSYGCVDINNDNFDAYFEKTASVPYGNYSDYSNRIVPTHLEISVLDDADILGFIGTLAYITHNKSCGSGGICFEPGTVGGTIHLIHNIQENILKHKES